MHNLFMKLFLVSVVVTLNYQNFESLYLSIETDYRRTASTIIFALQDSIENHGYFKLVCEFFVFFFVLKFVSFSEKVEDLIFPKKKSQI